MWWLAMAVGVVALSARLLGPQAAPSEPSVLIPTDPMLHLFRCGRDITLDRSHRPGRDLGSTPHIPAP